MGMDKVLGLSRTRTRCDVSRYHNTHAEVSGHGTGVWMRVSLTSRRNAAGDTAMMYQHQLLAYCEGEREPWEASFVSERPTPDAILNLDGMPRVLRIEWRVRELPDNGPMGAWQSPTGAVSFEQPEMIDGDVEWELRCDEAEQLRREMEGGED